MLTEIEAQDLMIKLIELRQEVQTSDDQELAKKLKKHEQICVEKFKYLITMKTGRYKAFGNYEDLNQEGFEALMKAMNNYNPKKGSFFWWAHKYIDTRISRSANLHTTIRYPLKVAKAVAPHKESVMPILIETRHCPDQELEDSQISQIIGDGLSALSDEQRKVINLVYGFDEDKPLSINKVCKQLNISRLNCTKLINSALLQLKERVKL